MPIKIFNNYDPNTHIGLLPVRVLQHNLTHHFENIHSDFIAELKHEVDFNNLNAGIGYHILSEKIRDCAEIDSKHKIHIYENFNQFVWSMCYSILLLFDESFQKPRIEGTFNSKFDLSNEHITTALDLFSTSMTLLKRFEKDKFYSLPNPEKYFEDYRKHIENANGLFVYAMVFVLIHEFAHHLLGHCDNDVSSEQSKKDELDADNYAFETVLKSGTKEQIETGRAGIIVGLCSLIFFNNSMSGGYSHPDPDYRLKEILDKMKLDDKNNLWGMASLSFILWANYYNIELNFQTEFGCYKELFKHIYSKLQILKAKT